MEVFGYMVGFFSFIIAILTGILTYLAWENGRWMRLAHTETQALIRNHHGDTLSLVERIEKGQEEARKEMAEAFRKMDSTLREIANLIVSESEKTRQAIKA